MMTPVVPSTRTIPQQTEKILWAKLSYFHRPMFVCRPILFALRKMLLFIAFKTIFCANPSWYRIMIYYITYIYNYCIQIREYRI